MKKLLIASLVLCLLSVSTLAYGERGHRLVGAIADRWSLSAGFMVVSLFMALGGVLWLLGMRHLERDTAMAPHRLP